MAELVKGHTYQIDLDGLAQPHVAEVLDSAGNVISEESHAGGRSDGSQSPLRARYKNADGSTGTVDVGGTATGEIEAEGDHDWFAVTLEANKAYRFDAKGKQLFQSLNGTLPNPYIDSLYRSDGTRIAGTHINDGGSYWDARIDYTATTAGIYTVAVTDITGGAPDDYTADTTTAMIDVGGTGTGEIQFHGDDDWFRVTLEANLTAGNVYRFDLMGAWSGDGTLDDPVLHGIRKADGTLIAGTGDRNSGTYTNDRAFYTPTSTGAYFVDAGGPGTGTYTLAVTNITDSHPDDHAAGPATTGSLDVDGSATGDIGHPGDRDWFSVTLEANTIYQIDLKGGPTGDGLPGFETLNDPYLHGTHNSSGTRIPGTSAGFVDPGYSTTAIALVSGTRSRCAPLDHGEPPPQPL